MADEEAQVSADVTAPTEVEHAASARQKKTRRPKKTAAEKAPAPEAAKPKTRGLTGREKQERVSQIEKDVAGGATLKDAVKAVGISDPTYYQWKKAASKSAVGQTSAKTSVKPVSGDDETAEFIALEEENRRLRKLVSEKLRAENADLRKRLGMV